MASRFARWTGWTTASVLALATAGYAVRESLANPIRPDAQEVPAERPAQPVRVTEVALVTLESGATYTGTVRPHDETPLGFRLPGKVIERLVDVGDRVAAGQIIARLDDTDARLELDSAVAEDTAARTDLARAMADLDRSQSLFAAGHIAQAALDRATSGKAEASARADRADRNRDLAENRLRYTVLRAETEGVVTAALAETGEVVAAGQPIATLARTDAPDVVFALPEQSRALLDSATATAEVWGEEGTTYPLRLRDVSPDVDPAGRTYRVRMVLEGSVALGRTVTVRLATSGAAPAIPLPLAAVLNDGQGAAVWRLPPGSDRVERVPVELQSLDGQVALVRGALQEGDLIISLGAHKIDPTRPVRVVETAPTPES
jgi:membrane fusion protein, multidrug efflux system